MEQPARMGGPPAVDEILVADRATETYVLNDKMGAHVTFVGQELGQANSHRKIHTHPGLQHAPKKWQCSGCRYFRATIYAVDPEAVVTVTGENGDVIRTYPPGSWRRYIVQTSGLSNIPDETERSTVYIFTSPVEVIRALTVTTRGPQPYLPEAAIDAISQAADVDPAFDAVYDALVDPLDRSQGDTMYSSVKV